MAIPSVALHPSKNQEKIGSWLEVGLGPEATVGPWCGHRRCGGPAIAFPQGNCTTAKPPRPKQQTTIVKTGRAAPTAAVAEVQSPVAASTGPA